MNNVEEGDVNMEQGPGLFVIEDVVKAMGEINTKKSGGGDWVFPSIIEHPEHTMVIASRILTMLTHIQRGGSLPAFWKRGRMALISKTGSTEVKVEDTRPIVVSTTALNITEKTI